MSIYEAVEEAQKHCRFHKPDCMICLFVHFNIEEDSFFCVMYDHNVSDTRDSSQ